MMNRRQEGSVVHMGVGVGGVVVLTRQRAATPTAPATPRWPSFSLLPAARLVMAHRQASEIGPAGLPSDDDMQGKYNSKMLRSYVTWKAYTMSQ